MRPTPGFELSGSGRRIVIDETSGRLPAAEERDGRALTSWTALTESGWTDARPALPIRIIGG
ncbi:hypothetical protein AB0392_43770 [Nonomuraea angiospora]|uniref:hypothetical protein n=1 Tax=Nonomuraea angiospora TaxID=46172 RepID=UPI00344D7E15